jgi:hypothetical protein
LKSTQAAIAAARRSMAPSGKEFFAKWDVELAKLQNEGIKARSESRKADVTQKLDSKLEKWNN